MIKKLPIELFTDIIKYINLDDIHLFYSINKTYNNYLIKNDLYTWDKLLKCNNANVTKTNNITYIKLKFYNISFPSEIKLKKMYYRNIKNIIKKDNDTYQSISK